MLNILGMIILIIILLIITTLLIGIKITFNYTKHDEKINGCLKIIILKKVEIYSQTYPSPKEDEKDREKKRDVKKIFNLIKPCIDDFIEYLKSVIKTLKLKKVKNHFIIGMDSFADTGKYIGIIWAILAVINSFDEKLRISAEPTFTKETFDGYGENELEIYPLKLVVPTVKLLLKKDVRNLIRGIRNDG